MKPRPQSLAAAPNEVKPSDPFSAFAEELTSALFFGVRKTSPDPESESSVVDAHARASQMRIQVHCAEFAEVDVALEGDL